MSMKKWEKDFVKESSIPLPDGGDTHIHPFGPKEDDFVITTRIPIPGGDPHKEHVPGPDLFPDPLKK